MARQLERLNACLQRALGNRQRGIQFEELEIIGSDVADECADDRFAVLIGIEKVGARGLRGASKTPPDIDFERQEIQCGLAPVAVLAAQERLL